MPFSNASLMPCSTGAMYSRGITPPTTLSSKMKPAPVSDGSHVDDHVAVLTLTTRLAHELSFALHDAPANRFAIRDLRTTDVRVDLELAHHPSDDDLEV